MRLLFISLCLSLVMITSPVIAKDKKPEKPMDHQAMMEAYAKLATPGEPHKLFASLAGSWTTKTKSWMEPGKPPMESTGTAEMNVAGRALSSTRLHRRHDGTALHRNWDQRL